MTIELSVLGPLEAATDDGSVRIGGRKDRVVLVVLVAWAGQVVSTDRLTDAVWGERPPRSSPKLLQNVVVRLRKALGAEVIDTTQGGYVLRVPSDAIDVRRFEQMVVDGRACAANGDWGAAATALSGALGLWRGPLLGELGEWPPAVAERARLDELHRCITEELAEAELACGRHRAWVADLEMMASAEPLRERRWALLALALYRCGRQAEALRTFQRARAALGELGLDPGPELQTLERAVSTQDTSLELGDQRPAESSSSEMVTFLFTDLEQSSRQWEADPEAMDRAIERHDQLLRSTIESRQGRVFSTAGDGFGAAFDSPAKAVRAAIDAQRALRSEPWPNSIELRARMGLHTGAASKREGSFFGPPVNRAARIMSTAHGGQVLLSQVTTRLVDEQRLGVRFVDLGPHGLRGLETPEHLYQLVVDQDDKAYPPPDAEGEATEHLPVPRPRVPAVGRLLGRDRELESLVRALEAGGPVLVLGPGGIGKSTLCRAVLREAAMQTPGLPGWFIRCDGLTDIETVVSAIGRELAIAPGPNLLNRTLDGLASTPGVLVLDNAETPWQADTARLEELFEELADIDVLRLVVAMRLGVPPIRPSWAHVERVEPLEPEPAAALFATIAGMSNDVDRVASLIAAVDRVPLAVELLAYVARTESSLDRLATRWRLERAALLDRGVGAADPRLSVPASVELSWKGAFMGVDAQRVGALLALAPAGLSLVDLDRAVPDCAARGAARLRQQALAFDDGERLRMLAPIREHIAAHHPPRDEDRDRLLDLWEAMAATDGKAVGRDGGGVAARRLDVEAANIEVGIAELVALGRVEAAGRAAVELANYYGFSGAPAGRGLQLVMDAAHSADDASTLAATSRFAALLARSRSELDTARLLLDQSLTLSRRLGDALLEAHCLRNLGDLQQMLGEVAVAREAFEDALQAYQNIESEPGVADCYLRLGELDLDESPVAARRLFGQAMQIYQSIGHRRGYANCLIGVGTLDFQESMIEDARALFNQALPICEDVGYPQGEANCYLILGRLDLEEDIYSGAQSNLTRALSLFEQLGDERRRDECYETLGELRNRMAAR